MKQTTTVCLAIYLAAAGCASSEMRREASTGVLPSEVVTIIQAEKILPDWDAGFPGFRGGDEEWIANCIGEAMHEVSPTLQLIPPGEFRASLFPWFEHATAPDNAGELASLLNKPLVQERIAALGLRYVIALDGSTTKGVHKGASGCGVHGCLGYVWWDENSKLSATVWDLKQVHSSGSLEVSASGRSSISFFILPFPFYSDASTEHTACTDLGEQLARFLTNRAQP